uniref:Uncharacterized protein n=1 Tax=Micrurus corallinus TaxID=54390 RepID=A0A2D4GJK1_MICCO
MGDGRARIRRKLLFVKKIVSASCTVFPKGLRQVRWGEAAMAEPPPKGLREALEAHLQGLGIQALSVEHPEVFTVEEMMPYVQHLNGAHSKNLFLKDKKKKAFGW